MDPIGNQMFSHDFKKFVLQEPNIRVIHLHPGKTPKPFNLNPPSKTKKPKKDSKKNQDEKKS